MLSKEATQIMDSLYFDVRTDASTTSWVTYAVATAAVVIIAIVYSPTGHKKKKRAAKRRADGRCAVIWMI